MAHALISLRTIRVSLSHQIVIMDILYRPSMKGNIRQEPKYIVFLSQLMLLFRFCQPCKSDDIIVETSERGTMICVETQCGYPKCLKRDFIWQSQPLLRYKDCSREHSFELCYITSWCFC